MADSRHALICAQLRKSDMHACCKTRMFSQLRALCAHTCRPNFPVNLPKDKTMSFVARYPGRCANTGAPIRPGDTVRSVARGRYALVARAEPAEPVDPDLALAASIDPDTAAAEPEASAAAGRYLRQSMARGVSDIWRSSTGREFYRNRRGLCEDAPCCGCCNA
jgi:hypothetical protein